MKSSHKGSGFEREVCKLLSEWWSNGKRTDIFWRTSGSGARACVRAKKNLETQNQHGDIAAIDPVGIPLTRVLTIELKRGYNRSTIADILDKPMGGALQWYEKWFIKIRESRKLAVSLSWLLITKRDHRDILAFFPYDFWRMTNFSLHPLSIFYFLLSDVVCIRFDDFLRKVKPQEIIEIHDRTF